MGSLVAASLWLLLAQAPGNECAQQWSFGPNGETLRNNIHVGGGIGERYQCVDGMTVFVLDQGGVNWWQWTGVEWVNMGATNPGGTPLPNECQQTWSFGPNNETLRNGSHAGGGYRASPQDVYRCVGGTEIWVAVGTGMEATEWTGWWHWRFDGFFWEGPTQIDPGGVVLSAARVAVGATFRVQGDHDGMGMPLGFRVYVDEVQFGQDIPLSALVNGVVTSFEMSLPSSGYHELKMSAFNATEEAKSDPLLVYVYQSRPPPPAGMVID